MVRHLTSTASWPLIASLCCYWPKPQMAFYCLCKLYGNRKGSQLKSLRTIIPLSSPGKQKPGQLLSFIYLYVWCTIPICKWSGRESALVLTSKLGFPFMYLSDNGAITIGGFKVYRLQRLGHFSVRPHQEAWIIQCCVTSVHAIFTLLFTVDKLL